MLSYCWKCRKNKDRKSLRVVRPKTGRILVLSKCLVFHSKIFKFTKEQQASRLLSILGIKRPLSKFPLLVPLLP